jgi:hypothetical protein
LVQATNSLNLGFLTIVDEGPSYIGGYLVTNLWGRPLEFRLSSGVQPNRMQEILFGATLQAYLCADLIGKALVEKAATPVQLLLTDHELTLDLRHRVATPVVWLARDVAISVPAQSVIRQATNDQPALVCHSRFPEDAVPIREITGKLDPSFDLLEPFSRIREALAEARSSNIARAA